MVKLETQTILFVAAITMVGFAMQEVIAQQAGPPKADIFARQVGDTAILVTWENPSDTAENIVYRYTVSRDVNKTETFTPIFDSLRNLEEKIIDTNGQEMFFYLDEDIQPNTIYEYRIGTAQVQGNPTPTLSDDTKQIYIHPRETNNEIISHGHLIVGRTVTPITEIISWFDWFDMQEVSADTFVNDIFTTTLNPQNEPYRMLLEPIPSPENQTKSCDQVLNFQYSKNLEDGQDFKIVASIFEKQIVRDDSPQSYSINQILKHQKTFNDFTDSIKVKNKWFAIHPEDQAILNFSALEVQLDITGDATPDPNEFRTLTVWGVYFIVPEGNQC
ncbi:MAG: hypothetical protein GTO44_09955 [Hydrotalea flava]|nr:hypothetical protein [Hydrotalea flava]NIN15376.1 hypothetical protein [Hydrotalea flava]